MWELDHKESCTPKNWCFWTMVLEETLKSPWTARRFIQFTLKEISPEYSLEGLMLKLKFQYSGHLIWRTDSFGKTLLLGKSKGRRRRGQQRMRWLDGITDSMDMSLWNSGRWWTEKPGVLPSMWSQNIRHNWVTELILNAFNSYYNPMMKVLLYLF